MTLVIEASGEEPDNASVVRAALAVLEREQEVRILFAAESGSRAWGFASPDSDYDVRFLYVPAWERYFTVSPQSDNLKAELPGDLDMAGWELRKALQLFGKGNGPLYEWLGSPIVYAEAPGLSDELRALLPVVFNPPVVLFHYLGLARRTLEGYLGEPRVRIKKLFYLLRPLFAARWIVEQRTMPPTRFGELVAAPWVSEEERVWVAELLARKARAGEAETMPFEAERRGELAAEVERLAALGPSLASRHEGLGKAKRELDALLLRWAGPASAAAWR